MTTHILRRWNQASFVAAFLLSPLLAKAHSFDVPMSAAPGSTHYVGVICSNDAGYDSDHLIANVRNNTLNAPLLNVQIIKGQSAAHATDTISGDNQASPSIQVRGGNGVYQLLINKAGAGALQYTLTVHCMDASGQIHTGTDGIVYQYE